MKKYGWKIVAVVLLLYTIIAGFLGEVPDLDNVHQTIRNLYFHVCMWFVMIFMLFISVVYSIKYLSGFDTKNDIVAVEAANTGVLFGMLGIVTGMLWAKFAWGQWWVNDPKLNGAAVGLLVYFAYFTLRSSLDDINKKARLSAVYNIFAFVIFILFILVLPKFSGGSLHPGDGKDSAIPIFTLDKNLRMVFYPAIIGWILLALWIMDLSVRYKKLKKVNHDDQ
jgi:heme exporter protein C